MRKYLVCLLAISLLSACGDGRGEKDKKLALGCQAGLKALLAQDKFDRQIDKVTSRKFKDESEGRRVTLKATTKNKQFGYEKDESFNCLFAETSNILGWKAEVQQLNIGEDVFGKKDGQIIGDMNDFLELTGAVEAAMK
ncbi:MAG: hypothetical protein DI586_04615 [Micavibrio aeruginosavorus]|uniref:Lipoprotein n=1 Tax=Micavibrio aeruginosavorus TaxID=349221 RepID=A0A2W5HKD8_9BACT|nr:MAG: hypothetical protein DI586_04615 [Micavibrio aeruginosavorus]